MDRSWVIVREGDTRTFETKIAEVCPLLKGLMKVKRAAARAAYMRKWHEQHDFDTEVRDGEVSPEEETES